MEAIVAGNPKTLAVLRAVWHFFDGYVQCEVISDDGMPSTHRVVGVESPTRIRADVGIVITVRRTSRLEEAFAHELLHADLIRRRFPVFWLREQLETQWNIGRDILNLAEHCVMLPLFAELGYDDGRFVGESRPLTGEGLRLQKYFATMQPSLSSPEGFEGCISACLREYDVDFEIVRGIVDFIETRRTDRRSSADNMS